MDRALPLIRKCTKDHVCLYFVECTESREMVDLFGENWSGAVIRYFVDAFISCKVKSLIKKKKKEKKNLHRGNS